MQNLIKEKGEKNSKILKMKESYKYLILLITYVMTI
jgi:hypothetical protein